ncbi:MAG: ABC transporter ATP-binding protein [Alphaproteobacteria bacterium]|nr:ABC transporter ATP-binding protein [Alphaproteobacteria bacterium]
MSKTKTFLSIRELSAGYGSKTVFSDLSFDVHENEIFGLIGLNGIGKTTMIKTILGLREPFSGGVFTANGDQKIDKSRISYLPERFDPPWFLSGYEFVKFSLSLYGREAPYEAVEEAAGKVSLNPEFLKKKVQTYSKGMRQKLGLLATIMTECPLLILDEPMSGLDPQARFEVKSLITQAKADGRSVFMSSHILSDMAELCDRVAVLDSGRIAFIGTPKEMDEKGGGKTLEESFLNLISPDLQAA